MADLKYNYGLDPDNHDSSHGKLLDMVEKGAMVLELGCATGYMTKVMKERLDCRVTCVEIDEKAAEIALPFCENMIVGDVESLNLQSGLPESSYDIILMADVLEHLKDAQGLLVRLREILAPGGFLLISIPNGVHGSVALEFLDGKADYRDTGLLDNTHLHFFDKQSFAQTLDAAGYLISHLDRVIVHPKDTELKTLWEKYPREITAYMEKVNPEFKTYQFVIKAFPTTLDGWKKGLEHAVESQKKIRRGIENKIDAVQKDLDWHKNEIRRLNYELGDKEDTYSRLLAGERTRLETEIKALHKAYRGEIQRLEKEYALAVETYSCEMERAGKEWQDQRDRISNEFMADKEGYETKILTLEKEIAQIHQGYQAEIDRMHQEIKKGIRAYDAVKNDFHGLEAHAGRLQQELDLVHGSLAWRFLNRYRRMLDRFLPENSWRRRLYRLSILAPVVLFREGPGAFFRKIAQRVPGKRGKQQPAVSFDLEFPVQESVEISIVIPVYNKVDYSYRCLKSIIEKSNTQIPYEVIVVDNGSSDNTADLLRNTKGLTPIINEENKGFVGACNMGADKARGRYILFLNNDTQVTEGWLDSLIKPFEEDKNVGITGAKLLYPDGTLQEAGNIIWQDASGWNYGRGGDPDCPAYCYEKEVDYCSGACLMIPAELWRKAGGFDQRYAPAYYEDTDLCFTIRKLGYKVIYQPLAKVVHYEGITSGTDINTGFKRFQQENHKKFFDKWKEVLAQQHYKGPDDLFYARQRRHGKTILVVDHYAPTFDRDSGSLRMFSILKILSRSGHQVVFWPENRAFNDYVRHLQGIGVEVLYGDIRFDEYMRENGRFFDLIIFSRPHVAVNMIYHARTFSKARIVYDTVDLHFLREERRAKFDAGCDAGYWKQIEFFLADMADDILVVSDVEKTTLEAHGYKDKVHVISNVHEIIGASTPFEKRRGLLFIGGFMHTPNEDAMIWFIEKIFPKIQQAIEGITCTIVGSHPTDAVRSLAGADIEITGYVSDVSSYFENSRVFISPLRYGAGVKGKIGQSLSFGLPVVTTPIGAEGMGAVDGENMLVAKDENQFAEKVIQLYHDQILWEKLSAKGMDLIEERFSPRVIKKGLDDLLGRIEEKGSCGD
ncbi:glycosyltransferase [uncultured Desulfobacter sp.]|uniref:glycosyltransferase n=1 Tax=uncultured Desulfobacter sp. TaxID=240139 RepID=UPI002AAA949F|nr:glycosyltransferase [uncultured Desulfobacter sp.]